MDSSAVEMASARYRKAERSLEALNAATNFADAEEAWTDFLLAASAIYSKLEQGAKGHCKADPWFGEIKHARKTDPLLRYLHFARTADYHGIERVTEKNAGQTALGMTPAFNERHPITIGHVNGPGELPTEPMTDAWIMGAHLTLVRAVNYGAYADPPETHLGTKIDHRYPKEVGEAVMPYLGLMIEAAAGFV